jgi:CheY-like chemotaxis protein
MAAALRSQGQAPFRYMIADDLLIHRKGIQHTVKLALDGLNCPFVCDCVDNGAEAVQMCAQTVYDLVIMDYNMPRMNGAEATCRILAVQPTAYIVGFTACEEPETIQKCLNAGMKKVLPKDWKQVREFVKKFIPDFILSSKLKRTSLG